MDFTKTLNHTAPDLKWGNFQNAEGSTQCNWISWLVKISAVAWAESSQHPLKSFIMNGSPGKRWREFTSGSSAFNQGQCMVGTHWVVREKKGRRERVQVGKEARKRDTKEKTLIPPTPITLSLKPEYTSVQQILGDGRMLPEANVSIRVNDSYHQHTPFFWWFTEFFLLLNMRTEGATT